MSKRFIPPLCIVALLGMTSPLFAQSFSGVVALVESGFPSADSAGASSSQISVALPEARLAQTEQLGELLRSPETHLLVLPYGSAFPEAAWPDIEAFLQRGGNLLVLGGRPFTRSVYGDANGWHLRDYSVRFARALMIDQ